MTLQEACKTYHLDGELLEQLAQRGVFGAELGDEDLCRAAVACFLHESGLSAQETAVYFLARDGGNTQRVMLRRLRAGALERAHAEQRRVDKLDCLLRKAEGAACEKNG